MDRAVPAPGRKAGPHRPAGRGAPDHSVVSVKRQPLFRKYVAVFVILVSGALITSGLVQLYFSYQENQTALLSIQREKAAGAATHIEQFLQVIERQIGGAIQVGPAGTPVSIDQRKGEYLRLLR